MTPRQEAQSLGLKKYFTGKLCKRGHISERYTDNRSCIRCYAEIVKPKYRASEGGRLQTAVYNNRDEGRTARTAHRLSDRGKAWDAEWRASPEGKAVILANNAKRRALHRERAVPLTKEEKARVKRLYEDAVWLAENTGVEHHVDHVIPLSRGGLHHPDNLQVMDAILNLKKKDLTHQEFLAYMYN